MRGKPALFLACLIILEKLLPMQLFVARGFDTIGQYRCSHLRDVVAILLLMIRRGIIVTRGLPGDFKL